jgi:hypothetical protein
MACRMSADVVTEIDEHGERRDVALCTFHVTLHDELGVTRTPAGYAKARKQARAQEQERDASPLEEEDLDFLGDVDGRSPKSVLDSIRARLGGLGASTREGVERVIADGLKATRWATFTCIGCGKRNRVNVADVPTRLATAKLATELGAPEPTAPGTAAWMTHTDTIDDETPTAVLMASAYPDREAWVMRHYEEGTLRRTVRDVQDVHRRHAAGKWVKPEELAQARKDVLALQTVRNLLEPVPELKFPAAAADRAVEA